MFGIILALGGIWLMWIVLTGTPFPWEDPNTQQTTTPTPASTRTRLNTQLATVASAGNGVPGAVLSGIRLGVLG